MTVHGFSGLLGSVPATTGDRDTKRERVRQAEGETEETNEMDKQSCKRSATRKARLLINSSMPWRRHPQ